jgi:hypothetical protein
MPAPSNISAATAVALGAAPVSYTQDVHDAGTTYTVWGSFTPTTSGEYGLWAFGALGTYTPKVRIYDGPVGAPVLLDASVNNKPMQFWMTAGTTYWLEFQTNSAVVSPAVLTFSLIAAPDSAIPAGAIFVPDDTDGYPAVVLSGATNYTALKFIYPFPAGENADRVNNGNLCVWDAAAGELVVVNRQFAEMSRVALTGVPDFGLRANRTLNKFFVIKVAAPNSTLYEFGPTGTLITSYTITGITDMNGIAVSNDGTKLYWATNNINASSVRRWNLSGGAALTDLAASIGSNYHCTDILVLEDDTILVMYNKSGPTSAVLVKRYQDDGTLLNTYDLGENTTTPARMAYANDSPTSFWGWTHLTLTTPGVEQFVNIRCSDGVVLATRLHMEFELGDYQGTATATPLARFGSSYSCPFVILGGSTGELLLIKADTDLDGIGGGGGGGGETGYNGLGGDDVGEQYIAWVKTRAYRPGRTIGQLGTVGKVQQSLVCCRESPATLQLEIDRDRGKEFRTDTVSLVANGAETRAIRKFEGNELADGSLYQFKLGDPEATNHRWSIDRFQIKRDEDGDR